MKTACNKMNVNNVSLGSDEYYIDTNRIKELTMKKIKENRYRLFWKKFLYITSSFAIFIIMSGTITYTLEENAVKSYIEGVLGLEPEKILLIGETVSNDNYSITVEDFAFNGIDGDVTLSISANSDSAKKNFATDRIDDKFGHFNFVSGIVELKEYNKMDKRVFSVSFSKPFYKNQTIITDVENLFFQFEGIENMIKIPLKPTKDRMVENVSTPLHRDDSMEFSSSYYSEKI